VIQENGGNTVHIEAQGIAEKEDHEKRVEQRAHETPDIPAHLDEFLLRERLDPPDAHGFSFRSTRATKTSSNVGSTGVT
jgi:hypothetical protein